MGIMSTRYGIGVVQTVIIGILLQTGLVVSDGAVMEYMPFPRSGHGKKRLVAMHAKRLCQRAKELDGCVHED